MCGRSRCRWCCSRRCTFAAVGALWAHVARPDARRGAVAFLVLLPWGLRNYIRYGELFLTDSHGGHTALVGANPNSDGRYSRSLNRLYAEGTGYALFAPPHRESDRAAYALAKPGRPRARLCARPARGQGRSAARPRAPAALLAALPRERAAGAARDCFDRHRAGVERVVDGFWYAAGRRDADRDRGPRLRAGTGRALALLPLPLALTALYALFFAEVRYHLAIVVLLLPFAGRRAALAGEPPAASCAAGRARRRSCPRRLVALARGGGLRRVAAAGRRGRRTCASATAGRSASARRRGQTRLCACAGDRSAARRGRLAGARRLGRLRPAAVGPRGSRRPSTSILPPGRYRISHAARRGSAPRFRPPSIWPPGGPIWPQAPWPGGGTPVTLGGDDRPRRRKAARRGRSGARNSNWPRR